MIQTFIEVATFCHQKVVGIFHLDQTKASLGVATIHIYCRPSESGSYLSDIALGKVAPQQSCRSSNATCGDTSATGYLLEAVLPVLFRFFHAQNRHGKAQTYEFDFSIRVGFADLFETTIHSANGNNSWI